MSTKLFPPAWRVSLIPLPVDPAKWDSSPPSWKCFVSRPDERYARDINLPPSISAPNVSCGHGRERVHIPPGRLSASSFSTCLTNPMTPKMRTMAMGFPTTRKAISLLMKARFSICRSSPASSCVYGLIFYADTMTMKGRVLETCAKVRIRCPPTRSSRWTLISTPGHTNKEGCISRLPHDNPKFYVTHQRLDMEVPIMIKTPNSLPCSCRIPLLGTPCWTPCRHILHGVDREWT